MPNEVVARDLKNHGLVIDLDELKARDWAMVPGVQIIPFPGRDGAVLAFDWAFVWRSRWFARGATGRTEQEAVDRLKLDDPIFHYMEITSVAVRAAFQDAGLNLPKNVAKAIRKAAAPELVARNDYIRAEALAGVEYLAITKEVRKRWPRDKPISVSQVTSIAKSGPEKPPPRKPGPKPK